MNTKHCLPAHVAAEEWRELNVGVAFIVKVNKLYVEYQTRERIKSSAFENTFRGQVVQAEAFHYTQWIILHEVHAHISLFTFVSRAGIIHKCLLLNHGNVLSRSIWHLHRCCSTSLPSSPLKSNTVQWNVNNFCRNVFKFKSKSVAGGCTSRTSGGGSRDKSARHLHMKNISPCQKNRNRQFLIVFVNIDLSITFLFIEATF